MNFLLEEPESMDRSGMVFWPQPRIRCATLEVLPQFKSFLFQTNKNEDNYVKRILNDSTYVKYLSLTETQKTPVNVTALLLVGTRNWISEFGFQIQQILSKDAYFSRGLENSLQSLLF